jgi:hypothetical protein
MGAETRLEYSPGPSGVGGWLGFFCLSQIFGGPFVALRSLLTNHLIVAVFALAFAAHSVHTGVTLWRVRPNALKVLSTWFAVWFAIECLLGLEAVADPKSVSVALFLWSFLPFAIWFWYFTHSVRVRNTYGRNL